MLINRRNVLVGLAAIVVMSGVLLGTGAFSTVEADRSVTVTTAGDGSALVGFDATSDYATYNDGELELDLNEANTNATITVNEAFRIENNGDQDISLNGTSWTMENSEINVTLKADRTDLDEGDSTAVEMKVKTYGADNSSEISEAITIKVDGDQ